MNFFEKSTEKVTPATMALDSGQPKHLSPLRPVVAFWCNGVFRCLSVVWAITVVSHAAHAEQPPGVHAGTDGRRLADPPATHDDFRLAILPDRTTGRDWGLPYLKMAVSDLNRIAPHAVISIGDMIQGYTRSTERWDREAAEFSAIAGELAMPFYPLAGNHEVVSGTRDREDLTFVRRYQKTFAPLYYSIEFDHATTIVCFSDDPAFHGDGHGFGPAQLRWLQGELDRAVERGKATFVLMHRPLWRQRHDQWNETIHPMLVEAGVDAVIAGHFHALQREPDRDGVEYHILGTCGGMIDQHPLAGQLQHLTFLRVSPEGEFSVYHQPVGMTLPDDYVRSVDQDRVFVLKTNRDVVRFAEAPVDPYHSAFDGKVQVELANPLDVPITVTVDLIDEAPEPHVWPGSLWVSQMKRDRFNPHVTDLETRFRLTAAPEPVVLEPGGRTSVELGLACPKLEAPRNPPEFHFEAAFEDTRGRRVPVIVRRRLPLRRTLRVPPSDETATWPICAWDFSVFETLEANPTLRLRPSGEDIEFILDVPDDAVSGYVGPEEDPADRFRNPMADAVLIEATDGSTLRRFYTEPFVSPDVWEVSDSEPATPIGVVRRIARGEAGWRLVLAVPRSAFDSRERASGALNVGVADNDGAYHSQWRWLAPVGRSATILLPE